MIFDEAFSNNATKHRNSRPVNPKRTTAQPGASGPKHAAPARFASPAGKPRINPANWIKRAPIQTRPALDVRNTSERIEAPTLGASLTTAACDRNATTAAEGGAVSRARRCLQHVVERQAAAYGCLGMCAGDFPLSRLPRVLFVFAQIYARWHHPARPAASTARITRTPTGTPHSARCNRLN